MNNKETIFIKILRWLGLVEKRPISKSEMCERAKDVCNHDCTLCAWAEVKERFGWSDEGVERLKKFHEEWKRLSKEE